MSQKPREFNFVKIIHNFIPSLKGHCVQSTAGPKIAKSLITKQQKLEQSLMQIKYTLPVRVFCLFEPIIISIAHLKDSAKTQRLLSEANARLSRMRHPDPYLRNYMPGGTLFMRNSPPPLEAVFPDGIPSHISK